MNSPVLLALEEGVPGTHIAADIVPIVGFIFFAGSVYVLLWSIYGAKKGALVYSTAFFAFGAIIGVYWWFGAPGTPPATGLTFFPGQQSDRYLPKWFAMEPGSERASFFPVTNSLENFQTPEEFLGLEGASAEELDADPRFRALVGDVNTSIDTMLAVWFPTGPNDAPILGANRRAEMTELAAEAQADPSVVPETHGPASPFLTARAAFQEDSDQPQVFVAESRGLRVAAAPLQVVANFVNEDPDAPPDAVEVVVEEQTFYAFQDPGALWFPSAVWTGLMGLAFLVSLYGLDRVEQREKRQLREREPVEV